MDGKTHREREFEEAIRRASERYRKRRARIDAIWRQAKEDPCYAFSSAQKLAARARYERRQGRRYLYARFGLRPSSSEDSTVFAYPIVRPERYPKDAGERMLRAEAVVEHAEWEVVWRALRKCRQFRPVDQGRAACKFACEAMRQSPALWAFFVENEPEESVREHALAELVGWLDTETRLYRRTREAVGSRQEKLRELSAVAMVAWDDLRPGEPFYLPNAYVRSVGKYRQKGSLAGRAGSMLDGLPELRGLSPERDVGEGFYGPADDELQAFMEAESARRELSALIERAGLSIRQAQVIERAGRGEEVAEIAAALGIKKSVVYVHHSNAMRKLRQAAGQ